MKLSKFNDVKELHPENILFIKLTDDVTKLFKFSDTKELHSENI